MVGTVLLLFNAFGVGSVMVNRGSEQVPALPEVCMTDPCSPLCWCANGVSTDWIDLASDFQVLCVSKARGTLHRMEGNAGF